MINSDKGSIHQEDIAIVNIYTPNTTAPKYIKQMLTGINRKMDNNTKIVGDVNMPVTSMNISSRPKISKSTEVQNDIIE